MSGAQLRHGASGQHLLSGRLRVALDLLHGLVAGDRHDLEFGAAEFGQPRGRRLAQAVRGAVRQARLVAPAPEAVAEAVVGEGPPLFGHEKRGRAGQRRVDDVLERGNDRQLKGDWPPGAVLLLREPQPAVLHMLLAEADDVGAALARIEEQRKGKARFASDRVLRLKLQNFFDRPGVKAAFLGEQVRHRHRRIGFGVSIFDREFVDLAKRLDHVVGAAWLVGFVVPPLSHVFGVERLRREIAADLADSIENFSPDILGARMQLPEIRRAIIFVAKPPERAGGLRLDFLRRQLFGRRISICRLLIGDPELLRPDGAGQSHLSLTPLSEIKADVAVPIGVLHHIFNSDFQIARRPMG